MYKRQDLDRDRPHLARAFQDALVDTLVAKTLRAAARHDRRRLVLGGGVACNRALVAAMTTAAVARGIQVFAPSPRLATDNAAMIGAAALFRLGRGERDDASLTAHAAAPMPGLVDATARRR